MTIGSAFARSGGRWLGPDRRLTHFGNSARLRLTAYATATAQVVYWDSILVTGGPGELDVAIQRLVQAMQTGEPARESAELDTVTEKESFSLARREANKTFGVRLTELPRISE